MLLQRDRAELCDRSNDNPEDSRPASEMDKDLFVMQKRVEISGRGGYI